MQVNERYRIFMKQVERYCTSNFGWNGNKCYSLCKDIRSLVFVDILMVIASHALVCCEIFRLASYLFVAVLLKLKTMGNFYCGVLPPMYCENVMGYFFTVPLLGTKSKKCHILPSTIVVKVVLILCHTQFSM